MTRRGGVLQFRCKADGCRESALISYDSKREAAELRARPYYIDYRCTRHSTPDKVLAPESGARRPGAVGPTVADRGVELYGDPGPARRGEAMRQCAQELCRNWSGDGNVCPCAVFGIEPDVVCGRCGCAPEWVPTCD